jgi:hypothetical protein
MIVLCTAVAMGKVDTRNNDLEDWMMVLGYLPQ